MRRTFYVLLITTLLIASALRLCCLTDFPPAVSGDEAVNGLEIVELIAHPHLTVFFPENTGREAMFFYLVSVFFIILEPNLFTLRIVPAFTGIFLVALGYRWTRELLPSSPQNKWIALIAAIFIATSPWGLYSSRIGLRGSLLPLFVLTTLLYFWRGYRYKQRKWFAISGIFLGLSTYTYTSSRLLPITLILFVLCVTFFYRKHATDRIGLLWQGLFLVGLFSLIVFLPLGWYFFNHPDTFWFRSIQVSLFNGNNFQFSSEQDSFIRSIFTEWAYHIYLFLKFATPWIQNGGQSFIWQWIPLLFWLGIFRSIYLARHHLVYFLIILSFFVGILPMVWSFPSTLRLSIAFPQTYVLLAIGAYYLLELLLKIEWSRHFRFVLVSTVPSIILLISTVSAVILFRFENWLIFPDISYEKRWVYFAPLPSLQDQAADIAAHRIADLVLEKKHSVLVPIEFLNSIRFTLQSDFSLSLTDVERQEFVSTETIYIAWSPMLGSEPRGLEFVLLSPNKIGDEGGIELAGHWKQEKNSVFNEIVSTQQFASDTIFVNFVTGQTFGVFFKTSRQQIMDSIEESSSISF